MSANTSRQSRKRRATRQRISDVATRLFFERGFDVVTIGEIAEAADVARMTVFNHFARKEDMFFDLNDKIREDMRAVLQHRDRLTSPVEALRLFVHRAFREERPYAHFLEAGTDRFMATIRASDALKNRARAIRDELTDALTTELAECVGRSLPDADASLAASLLLATWTVAITEARNAYDLDKDPARARQIFFRIAGQGVRGVEVALHGTPYVRSSTDSSDKSKRP